MIIDTSAILAILQDEPERERYAEIISRANKCLISSGTYLETKMILDRRFGYEGIRDFELFCSLVDLEIIAFDKDQAELATYAYKTYGKGRHKAGLNFGDCFSYALCKYLDEELLFKGEDFVFTDLIRAN